MQLLVADGEIKFESPTRENKSIVKRWKNLLEQDDDDTRNTASNILRFDVTIRSSLTHLRLPVKAEPVFQLNGQMLEDEATLLWY